MKGVLSGPIEFLNLVKNAQLVIGKSYHLVIFSILFHKNFITIKRKNESRIESLLNLLNVTGRNIESLEDYQQLKEIDYKAVDESLLQFKNESIRFLKESLK